jgi:hypothetical protein
MHAQMGQHSTASTWVRAVLDSRAGDEEPDAVLGRLGRPTLPDFDLAGFGTPPAVCGRGNNGAEDVPL